MRYFQLILVSFLLYVNTSMAAPYLQKGDVLFDPVFSMNKIGSDETLRELAEKGNPDALYWYATSLESKNIIKHAESYNYYKKAAEMGNPYAMLRISGEVGRSKYDCEIIGWPCNSEWEGKAIDKLIELKDQGDVKAYYYYNKYSGTIFSLLNPFGDHMTEEEMIVYAAEREYYTPLISYISRRTKTPEKVSDEMISVLDKAASKGFSPALYFRGDSFSRGLSYESKIELLKKAAHNGYIPSYGTISYLARKQSNDYITAYTYLYLEYLVTGQKSANLNSKDSYLYKFSSLSEIEIKEAIEKAEELYKNVEPEIYFDEGNFFYSSGMAIYR